MSKPNRRQVKKRRPLHPKSQRASDQSRGYLDKKSRWAQARLDKALGLEAGRN